MSWKASGRIEQAPQAYQAQASEGIWVVRTLTGLAACAESDDTLRWHLELDRAHAVVGPKLLALVSDLAVTVEDFGSRAPARVVAVHAQHGNPRWTTALPIQVSTFGLDVLDDQVLVHGRAENPRQSAIYRLDATSGEIRAVTYAVAGNGLRVVGKRALVPTSEGLFVLRTDRDALECVTRTATRGLFTRGRDAYFIEYDGADGAPRAVVHWDTQLARECGRFSDAPAIRQATLLIPLEERGHVLVVGELRSDIVDVGAAQVVAPIQTPPDTVVVSAVVTTHGLVALLSDSSMVRSVVTLDARSGEVGASVPTNRLRRAGLFSNDEHVLVSGKDLEFFGWQD
jgi:hypothetical protein